MTEYLISRKFRISFISTEKFSLNVRSFALVFPINLRSIDKILGNLIARLLRFLSNCN